MFLGSDILLDVCKVPEFPLSQRFHDNFHYCVFRFLQQKTEKKQPHKTPTKDIYQRNRVGSVI